MRFSPYVRLFQLTWQEYFAYRMNFALEVIGSIFLIVVTTLVWKILFQTQGSLIAGYSEREMITYVVGAGMISSFLLLTAQGDDINDDIQHGKLSILLLKPMHANMYWLIRDMCRKSLTFSIGIIGYSVVFFLHRDALFLPSSLGQFLLFAVFVVLAALLHFELFYVLSILGFWLEQAWGFRFVMRVVMEIAAGALIPLSLFAPLWQKIFSVLPFQFLAYVPMQVYIGKISSSQAFLFLGEGMLWLFGVALVGYIVWRRGIRLYTAQGS
jgi:ABC-2 type transport system permease protein